MIVGKRSGYETYDEKYIEDLIVMNCGRIIGIDMITSIQLRVQIFRIKSFDFWY